MARREEAATYGLEIARYRDKVFAMGKSLPNKMTALRIYSADRSNRNEPQSYHGSE